VIIITGVGRSGTSLVARIYAELGLDPGGRWDPAINAGLEDPEIVRINRAIMLELGVGLPTDPDLAERSLTTLEDGGLEAGDIAAPGSGMLDRPAVKLLTRPVPGPLRRAVRRRGERAMAALRSRWRGGLRRGMSGALEPGVVAAAAERHGAVLRDLARDRKLVKDPRFAWTLDVWMAAGAEIEYVLVCTRDIDAVVDSRVAAGHYEPARREDAKAALERGLRLCLDALHTHGLPHSVVRFPEVVRGSDALFAAMPLPQDVTRERFDAAFERVVDPDLVHHAGQ
jgi:hypothetical protein